MSAPCPQYGFEFRCRTALDLDDAAAGALWDALIEAVETRGLSAGGDGSGRDGRWDWVITRDGAQAIDADREALLAWARSRPEIVEATAGPLVDLSGD